MMNPPDPTVPRVPDGVKVASVLGGLLLMVTGAAIFVFTLLYYGVAAFNFGITTFFYSPGVAGMLLLVAGIMVVVLRVIPKQGGDR